MIVCDLVSVLLFLSVPVAAWRGVLTVGQLLAVALGAGAVAVFFQTADQAYLPSLLAPSELPRGQRGAARHRVGDAGRRPGAGRPDHPGGRRGERGAGRRAQLRRLRAVPARRSATREPRPARGAGPGCAGTSPRGSGSSARDPYLRVLTVFGAASNIGLIGYQSLLVVFLVREVGIGRRPGRRPDRRDQRRRRARRRARHPARPPGRHRPGDAALRTGGDPVGLLIPMTAARAPAGWSWSPAGSVIGAGVVAGNVVKASFRQRTRRRGCSAGSWSACSSSTSARSRWARCSRAAWPPRRRPAGDVVHDRWARADRLILLTGPLKSRAGPAGQRPRRSYRRGGEGQRHSKTAGSGGGSRT